MEMGDFGKKILDLKSIYLLPMKEYQDLKNKKYTSNATSNNNQILGTIS